MQERVVVNGKTYIYTPLDREVDLGEMLTIDPDDAVAEAMKFPYVMYKIERERIEAEESLRRTQAKLEALETALKADFDGEFRREMAEAKTKVTEAIVKAHVSKRIATDERLRGLRDAVGSLTTDADTLRGIYWSAKAKMNQLHKYST